MESPKISRILALLSSLTILMSCGNWLSVVLGLSQMSAMPAMMEEQMGVSFPTNFDYGSGTILALAFAGIWLLPYLILCVVQFFLKRTTLAGNIVLAVLSAVSILGAAIMQAFHTIIAFSGAEDEIARLYLHMAVTWLGVPSQGLELLSVGLLGASFAIRFYALRHPAAS